MSALVLPVAIVGNGGAAAEAVSALRACGCREEIHLFADNDHPPYNPMLGTYLVSGRLSRGQAFPFGDHTTFYGSNGVTAHLGNAIVRLDAETRELATAGGEVYRYDRCLVACGARPSVPPIPGLREALAVNYEEGRPRRVFTLQRLEDALAVRRAVDRLLAKRDGSGAAAQPPRAGVLGASFAGVKIAQALHDLGFEVVVIEREASILPLAAHLEAARVLEAHLRREGYELRLGAALAGVTVDDVSGRIHLDFGSLPGASEPGGAGGTACEDSAAQEEVDILVVCTGNRPALGFLTPGQVDLGTGVLVDEQMCSSVSGLWAAGDVAQGKNILSGRHEIIGLWSSARYHGRAAGRSMAGEVSGYPGGLPHNITHVGRMLFASVGCVNDYDEVTVTQTDTARQVRLWQDGRLVGINLVDCCLSAGVVKQAFARAAMGETTDLEMTWTSLSG